MAQVEADVHQTKAVYQHVIQTPSTIQL